MTSETPPVMLGHNEDDPTAHVENSIMFYYHLKQAAGVSDKNKVPASALHVYPRGGHGFGLCQSGNEAVDAGQPLGGFDACCDWPLHAQRFLQLAGMAPHIPSHPCADVYAPDGSLTCTDLII